MNGNRIFADTNIILYFLKGEKTIQIRKKFKLKFPDAIIAATALQVNLPIITAYQAFGRINSLEVILYEC